MKYYYSALITAQCLADSYNKAHTNNCSIIHTNLFSAKPKKATNRILSRYITLEIYLLHGSCIHDWQRSSSTFLLMLTEFCTVSVKLYRIPTTVAGSKKFELNSNLADNNINALVILFM